MIRNLSSLRFLLTAGFCLLLVHNGVAQNPQSGSLFQTTCAQCHGTKGEGREDLKTPSIANLPHWYVERQLTNFHSGKRGSDGQTDPQGFTMAAIAKALTSEQIKQVATEVEKLPLVPPQERTLAGANPQAGQQLFYERCMECHRYNASGEQLFGSPPLVGRQGWYLLAQLKKFKALHRGNAPGDEKGAKMVMMTTQFVENEQAMKDVVAYILTLNPAFGGEAK